jgi:membrane protein implicated in regulation of membrane protease activity
MPGCGRHRFEFLGKKPLAFFVVVALLFVNTFLLLLLEFAGKYFLPKNVPATVQWYQDNSVAIQFVLLALLAIILIIFRKRVRYSVRK